MIKKILLFIIALGILAISIIIPYVFSQQDENMTLNHVNVEAIEMNTKLQSTDDRLQFLLDNANKNGTNIFDYGGMAIIINDDQITKIYEEISKIEGLKDIINITKEDISQYNDCNINTVRDKDNSISIIDLSVTINHDELLYYCHFWFDSDTYKIYQFICYNKGNIKFKKIDLRENYLSYLGISNQTLINQYMISNQNYSIEIVFPSYYYETDSSSASN